MAKCRWVQRCARVQRQGQIQWVESMDMVMDMQGAARAKAALTCSEDETVARGFSLSQCPTSASSSTSLTAVSDLHTPWSHSLSCWLPLLIDAGARSCR